MMNITYRVASLQDLEQVWAYNVAAHPKDPRWQHWAQEYIGYNMDGRAVTFVAMCDQEPIGEVTLLIDQSCSAIDGNTLLADRQNIANINALRVRKPWEGQGHASSLVRCAETYAAEHGFRELTIGVDANETRNIGIYLHWNYDKYVCFEIENNIPVLYYAKTLK